VTPMSGREQQLVAERAADYEVNDSAVSSNNPEARIDITA
jgi:lipoate-protein ligase A